MKMVFQLENIPTNPPKDVQKNQAKKELLAIKKEMGELQRKLFAEKKTALLIILQGLDASGKDSLIRKVFSGLNPAYTHVKAYGPPTEEEMAHDFLWRVHPHVTGKGMISIFNRSQYEDILVPLVKGKISEKGAYRRLDFINHFEEMLQEVNNTLILKFYLHISQERQAEKLESRMKSPRKRWKYEKSDQKNAKLFDEYRKVYEMIFASPGEASGWNIIPSDKKWYKNYLVGHKVLEALREIDPKYP